MRREARSGSGGAEWGVARGGALRGSWRLNKFKRVCGGAYLPDTMLAPAEWRGVAWRDVAWRGTARVGSRDQVVCTRPGEKVKHCS